MACLESNDLTVTQSRLLPIVILLCRQCYRLKYEPRPVIILKARSEGMDSVKDYLANGKYYGERIQAVELI